MTRCLQLTCMYMLCLLFNSCENNTLTMPSNKEVVFQLPANQSYQFEIKQVHEFVNSIGKQQMGDSLGTQIHLLYSTTGSNDALVRMGKVVELNKEQVESEVADNPFKQALKAFDGSTFSISLTSSGEVSRVSGFADFEKKYAEIFRATASKEDLPFVSISYEEEFFKNIFNSISNTLINGKAVVENSWEKVETEDLRGGDSISMRYRFDKLQNGVAYLSSSGRITKKIPFNNTIMVLNGSVKGEYELEEGTAILKKSKRVIEMSGSIKLNKVPFTMTVRKIIDISGNRVG
jgi:hypothetical protein